MIEAGRLSAAILPYGATLQALWLEGHDHSLVLGFDTELDYRTQGHFVGATVGRFANRIGKARFALHGKLHTLAANEGDNILHGGVDGFHVQAWNVLACGDDFVTLGHDSPAGAMGFPGALAAQCRYRIRDGKTLEITYRCRADETTICSLSNHSYFNLSDGGLTAIDGHRIMIAADHVTPTDGWDIPTGAVATCRGSEFDFRLARGIGAQPCDINFCLSDHRRGVELAAELTGRHVSMTLETTEPGLQFYTGDYLEGLPIGSGGMAYRRRSGLCLEPQIWPDAPNHEHFPSAVLQAGEVVEQCTRYRFAALDERV